MADDFASAYRVLNSLARSVTAKPGSRLMHHLGEMAINITLDRTKKGQDIFGSRFKPYSPDYKTWRENKKRLSGTTVDLSVSGTMILALMITSTDADTVDVGFADPHAAMLAAVHHNGGETRPYPPARPWLDIVRPEEISKLETELSDFVTQRLDKALDKASKVK